MATLTRLIRPACSALNCRPDKALRLPSGNAATGYSGEPGQQRFSRQIKVRAAKTSGIDQLRNLIPQHV